MLDLDNFKSPLFVRNKHPEHQDACCNHYLQAPVCNFATKDKQSCQYYAPNQEERNVHGQNLRSPVEAKPVEKCFTTWPGPFRLPHELDLLVYVLSSTFLSFLLLLSILSCRFQLLQLLQFLLILCLTLSHNNIWRIFMLSTLVHESLFRLHSLEYIVGLAFCLPILLSFCIAAVS